MNNIFQLALREQYPLLPAAIRSFHETRISQYSGKAVVKGSNGLLARALRKFSGFPGPSEGETDCRVYVIREVQERWQRQIGTQRFSSVLKRVSRGNLLREDFGMFRFYYSLSVRNLGIHWQFERWELAGIPMPELLSPEVAAREDVDEQGRYRFAVKVEFPLVGVLLDYQGWLSE